jgi:hypothetical protein
VNSVSAKGTIRTFLITMPNDTFLFFLVIYVTFMLHDLLANHRTLREYFIFSNKIQKEILLSV